MSIRIKNWQNPVDERVMKRGEIEIVPPTKEELLRLKVGDRVLVDVKYDGINILGTPIVISNGERFGIIEIAAIVEPEEEPEANSVTNMTDELIKRIEECQEIVKKMQEKVK